jgi:hypothetical protein
MFTKAQIAKLPAEDQEVLAQLELSKARRRQKLLEQAHGLDWRSRCVPIVIWTPCLILLVLEFCNVFDSKEMPYVYYAISGLIIFSSLICALNARINRRLDVLLELLDCDHKNQDASNHSKDEKAG